MTEMIAVSRLFLRQSIPWWWGFSLSLVLPLCLLAFLVTGPHGVEVSLIWLLPVPFLIVLDCFSGPERRMVPSGESEYFFSWILALIALLAPLNLLALGRYVEAISEAYFTREWWVTGLDLLALRMLGGTTWCCSVIAPAHELMHRRSRWVRRVSRGLLILVFADAFYFAHGAGHHRHLGRSEDPSTAYLGETYPRFFWRSVTTQWKIASRRYPRNFLFGLAIEIVLLTLFAWRFGLLAAVVWLYLSWVAIRLLEAVNYFQHYGLTEEGASGQPLAWQCDHAVSYFLFLGLSRHADHHLRPMTPFTGLLPSESGPKLPLGYLGTAIWVKNHSSSFGRFAQEALKFDRRY